MKTRNYLEAKPSWQVIDENEKNPKKGITTFKLLGASALIVSGLLGYNLYEDATTIDDNALKIEVTTFSNPTDSGMDSARDQLPEHIVKLIDKSEMGSVISEEITEETGEKPNKQGVHTLTVTVEHDGDVEDAELEK
ncbi:hypothetical protein KA025_00385 [Candidatus Saccharibacteria bacterium]|nr:hypothetical protein [Candidatus Saccharibacteria bacterium]MBP7834529.1 hypothetical protein [Candidatus Saccharibacteria bacterium]